VGEKRKADSEAGAEIVGAAGSGAGAALTEAKSVLKSQKVFSKVSASVKSYVMSLHDAY
jgi:hypothetical protein